MDASFSPAPEAPALVIGAAGVDMIGRLQDELQVGTSNPSQIRSSFGGVARNVAENLARLGQPVVLLTAVGDDQAGDRLLKTCQAAGVDVSSVLCTSDYPTGAYLAAVDQRGELQVALDDMRAISALTPQYLRSKKALFQQASLVFVDANLAPATLRTAVSLAGRGRLPVCADPTSRSLAPRLRPHLSRLQLVTPNIAEAGILCGQAARSNHSEQALEFAKRLVASGAGLVIITLGEAGVCYATSETSGQVPAIRTEIVDPTGAGDALSAAVIFALLNDIPLDDAVRLGVSAASLTLRCPAAVLPDLSLEKLYDQLVI